MNEVHVWLAPEALVDAPGISAVLHSLLPDDEAARLAGFSAGTPRRLHLLTRALQRAMLSRLYPGTAPRDWRFDRSAAGRLSLSSVHAPGVDFNLAHTPGLVVMAAGRDMTVGIDVERFGRRRSLEIARRYFSAGEVSAIEALPTDVQPRRFIELWTLKEAYLKAIGTGISGGLGSMTFEWHGDSIRFERASDPQASRWQFRQWPWGSEHLLALACLTPGAANLACREVSAADLVAAASGQEQGSEA